MSHPTSCTDPDCGLSYVEHLRGIAIAAAATPTRRPEVVRIDATERRWDKDMGAYRALRRQGYQPEQIDGCDRLSATAKTVDQIEGRPPPLEDVA